MLKEIAAWREREAQKRDIPRNRILRDDSLLDIAAHAPQSEEALGRTRGLSKGFAEGKMGASLIQAVKRGLKLPEEDIPTRPKRERLPQGIGPLTDLLKVLLKHECEKNNVASRLVASADDLMRIAADDRADVPALKGWRRDLFGKAALDLKHGRVALSSQSGHVTVIKTEDGKAVAPKAAAYRSPCRRISAPPPGRPRACNIRSIPRRTRSRASAWKRRSTTSPTRMSACSGNEQRHLVGLAVEAHLLQQRDHPAGKGVAEPHGEPDAARPDLFLFAEQRAGFLTDQSFLSMECREATASAMKTRPG